MPLHAKDRIRESLEDDLYASVDLSVSMPKYRFPESEQDPRHAYSVVHDELMLDGNSRQNLATFCQTWAEPEVHRLMDECLDKNMVDKDEYPQTAEIEARCVRMLADLWNSPEGANTVGCSTTGSSEAAMLGGMAMKRAWESQRKAAGKLIDRPNREGYRKIHGACYETARYLASEIEKLGPFEMIYGGDENAGIPALCWKLRDGADPGFSLYDLADRLRSRGWQVPAYSLPANRQDVVIQRILVRHGVSRDLGSLLIDDIKRALEYFKQHPLTSPLTAAEASGFHH